MATKKTDQTEEAASPLMQSIDPRQVAANNLTATPDEDDNRTQDVPDPKDNPAAADDVSNTAAPDDPMTLTGSDAEPGDSGQ
jgi:hypothetical protein